MNTVVSPAVAKLVAGILKLLDSPNQFERDAAYSKLRAVLTSHGLTMRDFIGDPAEPTDFQRSTSASRPWQQPQAPPQSQQPYDGDRPWQEVAEVCLKNATRYSAKEQKFLEDMRDWHAKPSQKQLDWLASLYKRVNRDWGNVP